MKKLLLVILGLFVLLPIFAQDFEYTYEGQTLTYTVESSENKTCVTKQGRYNSGIAYPGNRVSGKLILPDKVVYEGDTYTLVGIGINGFPTCEISEIEFPSNLEFIGSFAFQGCSGLTSVSIPESVTSIGDSAFGGCSGLTSVIIPNSVTSIGNEAFCECSGLTSVIIGNSVTSIGNYAFQGCGGLTSVIIGNSVTSIGNYAFRYCSGLTSVIIGNSVTSIGYDVFKDCRGLKKSAYPSSISNPFKSGLTISYNPEGSIIEDGWIYGPEKKEIRFAPWNLEGEFTIPDSVTSIAGEAFYGCSGLTSVTIGDSVTSIGASAFWRCIGLTSVTIGNSVTSIGDSAFGGCTGLTSVIIPNSVTSIGGGAFNGCTGLTSVIIPNSVTSIGDGTFWGCSGLTSVIIPNSVTSIGNCAFYECTGLTEVSVDSETPPTISPDSWASSTYQTACLKIPAGSSSDYISSYWVYFQNMKCGEYLLSTLSDEVLQYRILPDPENRVAYVIKGDYSDLTEITIPERITDASDPANPVRYYVAGIASGAFSNLEKLKTVTFNKRSVITNIGSYAFNGCTGLTSLSIPESVTSIGNDAFNGCSGLTSVIIPNSVTSIGNDAFRGCSGLTSAIIGNSVTSIGNSAFWGCSGLTSAIIGNSVTSIGNDAFGYCSSLTSVIIPNSVTSIGNTAFRGCGGLTKAEFASIEALCKTTFGDRWSNPLNNAHNLWIAGENITILTIPDSVEAIGSYAFSGGSRIATVSIPESVTSIGNGAFSGCTGLTSITIPNSVTSIEEYAFRDCDGLTAVTIGNSLESINENVFQAADKIKSLAITDGSTPLTLSGKFPWNLETLYLGRRINVSFNSINNVTVGNLIESVDAAQFKDFTNLKSVTLGSGLKSIEDQAFSGCTRLTEIVIPYAVETIGESAFAGCSNLANIIMGSEVKSIANNAFNGTKAINVYITAQTPPTAPNTTFSNYSGKLWLQDPGDESVMDAYYNTFTCWDRFDSYAMIQAESIEVPIPTIMEGQRTIQLSAALTPENATLPNIFWSSSNPEVATVDCNGLVTLQPRKKGETRAADAGQCIITASTLYADGPIAQVTINNNISTGIDIIPSAGPNSISAIDFASPYDIYSINGVRIGNSIENLVKGIYVIRQGKTTSKIAVK